MASGLDAVGVAASIIQLADFGAQLSMKLYTFYHQVKNADSRLHALSGNVSLTCTVLKQLGETLEQDEQARLYSHEALNTAKQVSVDCDAIFRKIDGALDHLKDGLQKNPLQRAAARVGFVFMENDINILRSNLEQLKTTMLLLLNVIMYAGQIRSRAESKVLKEQSEFIQSLVVEKGATDDQYSRLSKVIQNPGNKLFDHDDPLSGSIPDELKSYCSLVERILCEMSAIQLSLQQDQYWRVRDGVLKLHSDEIKQCELAYGKDVSQFLRDGLARFYSHPGNLDPFISRSPLDRFCLPAHSAPFSSPLPDLRPPTSLPFPSLREVLGLGATANSNVDASFRSPTEEIELSLGSPNERPPSLMATQEESADPLGVQERSPAEGPGSRPDIQTEGKVPSTRYSDKNRPDWAEFERDHSSHELSEQSEDPNPPFINTKAQRALDLLMHPPRRGDIKLFSGDKEILRDIDNQSKRKRESSEDYSAGKDISNEDTQLQDMQKPAKAARRESRDMSDFESIVLAWTTLDKHELVSGA